MAEKTYPRLTEPVIAHGAVALFTSRAATETAGRDLVDAGVAGSVVVHTAIDGWDGPWLGVVRASGDDPAAVGQALLAAAAVDSGAAVYAATIRQMWAPERTWADGEQSPGLGALFAISRNPALTHDQFEAHWRDNHGPLADRYHPGMWDYVQCGFDGPLSPDAPPRDGLALCKFASMTDLKERFFDSDEGRAAIAADVRRFSDVNASPSVRMTETILR